MDVLLTHEDFHPSLNQPYRLTASDVQVPLTLIEVKRLRGPQRKEDKRDQFSLLFQGPPSPLLPQHQYPLHHERLGEITVFLVPVGRVDQRHQDPAADVLYEAVFT